MTERLAGRCVEQRLHAKLQRGAAEQIVPLGAASRRCAAGLSEAQAIVLIEHQHGVVQRRHGLAEQRSDDSSNCKPLALAAVSASALMS